MSKLICLTLLFFSTLSFANEVVVYTSRHYDTDKELFRMFTKETGIEVKSIEGKADLLITRLQREGENTAADILITVDAGRLHRAKSMDLLQPVQSKTLQENIPTHLSDSEGYWHGLSKRARVIVYHKERVNPAHLSTYEDLLQKKYQGKILIRSSSNIYNQSLLASKIAHHGIPAATTWANSIRQHMARAPKGNDRDQVKAVAAGLGDIAIVNTYYIGKMVNSSNPIEREVSQKVAIFFPNQKDRGTHINVSGAGVTKHSKNKANAIKLIEFLTSATAQEFFAKTNYEYPVKPGTPLPSLLKSWGEFKEDTLNLGKLGEHNKDAVQVFAKVKWDRGP